MRAAFTLVEVVAAAAIASLAGIALLQMNSQSTFLFSRLSETAAVSETLSLVAIHADKRFNRTTKSLYDILGDTYTIDNDEMRKFLQAQRYDYSERVVDTAGLDSQTLPQTGEAFSENDLQDAAAAPVIQFELIQVGIKQNDRHGAVLIARPF